MNSIDKITLFIAGDEYLLSDDFSYGVGSNTSLTLKELCLLTGSEFFLEINSLDSGEYLALNSMGENGLINISLFFDDNWYDLSATIHSISIANGFFLLRLTVKP